MSRTERVIKEIYLQPRLPGFGAASVNKMLTRYQELKKLGLLEKIDFENPLFPDLELPRFEEEELETEPAKPVEKEVVRMAGYGGLSERLANQAAKINKHLQGDY